MVDILLATKIPNGNSMDCLFEDSSTHIIENAFYLFGLYSYTQTMHRDEEEIRWHKHIVIQITDWAPSIYLYYTREVC